MIDIFNIKGNIKCYGWYRVPIVFSKKFIKLYSPKVFEPNFLYLQSNDENEKVFFNRVFSDYESLGINTTN